MSSPVASTWPEDDEIKHQFRGVEPHFLLPLPRRTLGGGLEKNRSITRRSHAPSRLELLKTMANFPVEFDEIRELMRLLKSSSRPLRPSTTMPVLVVALTCRLPFVIPGLPSSCAKRTFTSRISGCARFYEAFSLLRAASRHADRTLRRWYTLFWLLYVYKHIYIYLCTYIYVQNHAPVRPSNWPLR